MSEKKTSKTVRVSAKKEAVSPQKSKSGTGAKKAKTVKLEPSDLLGMLLQLPRSEWPKEWFETERALELLEEFYRVLLENCTDEDGDVDTRVVLELLASMTGIFLADYSEFYGTEKTLALFRNFSSLTLNVYADRQAASVEE